MQVNQGAKNSYYHAVNGSKSLYKNEGTVGCTAAYSKICIQQTVDSFMHRYDVVMWQSLPLTLFVDKSDPVTLVIVIKNLRFQCHLAEIDRLNGHAALSEAKKYA